MKGDNKSNYTLVVVLAAASHANGAAAYTTAIDHALAPSVSFLISAGTIGSSGTIDAVVQYSADGSTYTDEPDTTAGNSTSITQITAAGSAVLHVPNPRGRYSRVKYTVGTAASVFGIVACYGPLRHVDQG